MSVNYNPIIIVGVELEYQEEARDMFNQTALAKLPENLQGEESDIDDLTDFLQGNDLDLPEIICMNYYDSDYYSFGYKINFQPISTIQERINAAGEKFRKFNPEIEPDVIHSVVTS